MSVSALDQLAELAGIEPSYADYFGRRTVTSAATKRAFLRAMGFAVDSAKDENAALAALEEKPWRRPLDPVTVASHGAVLRIAMTLPLVRFSSAFDWSLEEEDGRVHRGRAAALEAAIAERTLEGQLYRRATLEIPVTPAPGYHRLLIERVGEATVVVAPARCYLPPAIERGAKVWGIAAQAYSLRSRRNWGMGDFSDLRTLAATAAEAGAAALGVNPLHQLDSSNPYAASPYSPSSRLYLNVAYLDVEAIEDFAECEEARRLAREPSFLRRLADVRASGLVDYGGVAACKRPVLELLYASFLRRHVAADTVRARAFRAFRDEQGPPLERLALYEALREEFGAAAAWPAELRHPCSRAVAAYAREHERRTGFFTYLQWNADLQLACVSRACDGMTVGLYRDLAVGVENDSAEAWAQPQVLARGVVVGAPPDSLNAHGQNWGLLPLDPLALRERAYAPFVQLMRANMRHAGALRIDHAMSLQRLFWIPAGRPAVEGTYVRYPLHDLLAIVALESQRNDCLVIGEDLGTVPEGFRERLAWSRIFSYRLLYFERDAHGAFTSPDDYPPLALVSPGTHDLPTLSGYWRGADLHLRAGLGLLGEDTTLDDALATRERERIALLAALVDDGDLQRDVAHRLAASGAEASAADVRLLIDAAYRYLAHARARLLMAPVEDVFGVVEPINVPGTTDQHPNWRRKLPVPVDEMLADERFASFAAKLQELRGLPPPPSVPTATYRLQFQCGFGFADAERIVPYLHALGISHVYASPFFAARAGSTHGYDVTDHGAFNPELGTRAGFERMVAALHRHGMGLVADFVPNHMGVGSGNPWWQDVLEWGRASPYAPFFDIDWRPAQPALRDKVLLPFLGAPYGDVLRAGQLSLGFDEDAGTFALGYGEQRFPLAPPTYATILAAARDVAREAGEHGAAATLDELREAFLRCGAMRPRAARARQREQAVAAKRRLHESARDEATLRSIYEATRRWNGDVAEPSSFDALHRLIGAQHYRPAFWRVALDEINYRRFFDINDLAGLRMEYAECFGLVHRLVFRLIEDGLVQGLRIDHVDGLFDPKSYTTLLRTRALALDYPLYLVVEKILARHETLRGEWLVAGTTGYEFASLVNGLFVDPRSEARLDLMYRAFTGDGASFDDVLAASKRMMADVNLASELEVLATHLDRIAQSDLRSSDLTRTVLRNALADVVEAFPVYRTYVSGEGASAQDRRYIEWALAQARKRSSALDLDVFTFIGSVLTTDALADPDSRYRRRDVIEFAMRFQQYTAPVMAKAYEDTAFYRYARLLSLNEVGGDPRRFGTSPASFHRAMRDRAAKTPYGLSTTATHDMKRGEDTRLRIDALCELPGLGRRTLLRLARINRRLKRPYEGAEAPDRLDEWYLYQTLVGTWPLERLFAESDEPIASEQYVARIQTTMRKAIREAKRRTSWANPVTAYEDATAGFVAGVLAAEADSPFWTEFRPLARAAARIAMVHGLAQVVLKLTAPGVPDLYQGTELWDHHLVDPDNRGLVDWRLRERLCATLRQPSDDGPDSARALLESWHDGRVKMFVTRTLLGLRQKRREMFLNDDYVALEVTGPEAERVVAYERRGAVVVVPRLVGALDAATGPPLGEAWGDTALAARPRRAPRVHRNVFTGARVRIGGAPLALAEAFRDFPVAVFEPEDEA